MLQICYLQFTSGPTPSFPLCRQESDDWESNRWGGTKISHTHTIGPSVLKYGLVWGHGSDLPATCESTECASGTIWSQCLPSPIFLFPSPCFYSALTGGYIDFEAVLLRSVVRSQEHQPHRRLLKTAKIQAPPKLTESEAWAWHPPAICFLTSPPAIQAVSSLRTWF